MKLGKIKGSKNKTYFQSFLFYKILHNRLQREYKIGTKVLGLILHLLHLWDSIYINSFRAYVVWKNVYKYNVLFTKAKANEQERIIYILFILYAFWKSAFWCNLKTNAYFYHFISQVLSMREDLTDIAMKYLIFLRRLLLHYLY